MGKKLSEMSLEELWQLFPITLTTHRTYWKAWYTEEADLLQHILPTDCIDRISHIGSTAVAGIWAKPIIDILVEVSEDSDFRSMKIMVQSALSEQAPTVILYHYFRMAEMVLQIHDYKEKYIYNSVKYVL